jgi:hypothetical protein
LVLPILLQDYRQEQQKRIMKLLNWVLARAQAEATDSDPNFATDRIDPVTNKPIGKMTNREWSNYLKDRKAEEDLKNAANPDITIAYVKGLNKEVDATVLNMFGSTTTDLGTVDFKSVDEYNQALQLGFAGVVSSVASERAGSLRTAPEQTAFFSEMSSPSSINALIKGVFAKEEGTRTQKEQELVAFVNQAPNLQQKLKQLGVLPTSESTTTTKTDSAEPPASTTKTDSAEPPASTNETDSAEPPASTNETDSAEPPDLTKVLSTKDITDANIDGRLAYLSRKIGVDFNNLTSLRNWLVRVKGQSDMRIYFDLSTGPISTEVVNELQEEIKTKNITNPREVVEILTQKLANK